MMLAQLSVKEIISLFEQLKTFISNPYEYRQQLAVLLAAFVIFILILILFTFSVANFFEERRVKKAIRRRARRKLTPVEKALRTALMLGAFLLVVTGYYYSHYESSFCSSCHEIKQATKEHLLSKPHRKVRCIYCHTEPGVFGKLKSLPREFRNLLVHLEVIEKRGSVLAYDNACLGCHYKIRTEISKGINRVRHADFIDNYQFFVPCSRCHIKSGHQDRNLPSKEICSKCHNGERAFAMKDCKKCHDEDVTLRSSSSQKEVLIQKVGTGTLKCYNACHPKEVDAICTPCHGTEMPHPQLFIRRHAANSFANRNLCVRCHAENGATPKRACGCHPEEGDTMHGTFEWWFVEHQKAAKSNPYMNCLCHASSFGGNVCEFCHVEGNPLTKAMIQTEILNRTSTFTPVINAP